MGRREYLKLILFTLTEYIICYIQNFYIFLKIVNVVLKLFKQQYHPGAKNLNRHDFRKKASVCV
jgi:hypothetical protein